SKAGLSLALSYRDRPPVGSVEELLSFLGKCRERAARMKGQVAKHAKVRNIRGAAILARLAELGRKHQFDFFAKPNAVNVRVRIRFDGLHLAELIIPTAKFDEMVVQLEEALPALRELGRAGLVANLRPNYASHGVRDSKWTLHTTSTEQDITTPES